MGNELKINETAIKMLNSIADEIIITTMFGKEKSGKSYLMNLLINEDAKGFKISNSIEKNAKGINIWGNFREKSKTKTKLLFIDTDMSSNKNSSFDPKIFALLYLISSNLVYNTSSFLDENAISEFSIVPEIPNSILTNVIIS